MDNWKSLLITFALVGLFAIGLINYAVIMQVNNNVNNTILVDSPLSAFNNTIYGNLSSLQGNSNSYYQGVQNESAQAIPPSGALTLNSIFFSLPKFGSFLINLFISFFSLFNYIGISPLISSVLMGILLITIILLFWRLVKWGS